MQRQRDQAPDAAFPPGAASSAGGKVQPGGGGQRRHRRVWRRRSGSRMHPRAADLAAGRYRAAAPALPLAATPRRMPSPSQLNDRATPPSGSRSVTVAGKVAVGAVEAQHVAGVQAPRTAGQGVPGAVGARAIQRDAYVARRRRGIRAQPPRGELRRDHPRVVRHQHVAWTQQVGQVAHHPVGQIVARDDAASRAEFAGPDAAALCGPPAWRSRTRQRCRGPSGRGGHQVGAATIATA